MSAPIGAQWYMVCETCGACWPIVAPHAAACAPGHRAVARCKSGFADWTFDEIAAWRQAQEEALARLTARHGAA